jgi:hypothetical protein
MVHYLVHYSIIASRVLPRLKSNIILALKAPYMTSKSQECLKFGGLLAKFACLGVGASLAPPALRFGHRPPAYLDFGHLAPAAYMSVRARLFWYRWVVYEDNLDRESPVKAT